MHVVAVLVRHGVMPLELGLVHQLFRQAVGPDGSRLYEVLTCAVEPGEIRTNADVTISVRHGVDVLARADTVVVPASYEDDASMTEGVVPEPLARGLASVRPGTRVASICTGSFLLAAAGLLDGARATTHWRAVEAFRRLFPRVDLDPDVLYVDNGDVLTSAGEAAGIDLCLHMIRCDHGAAVAADVARATIVPPHREGGQAQYVPRPVTDGDRRASTAPARAWAAEHLDQPLDLPAMAERCAMSVRTFTRRFRAETGTSPAQWLAVRRLDRARELLEETDLPVEHVARATGFGSPVSLRQHLHAALGVTPRAYRATFRGSPTRESPRP